jgi:hypothetical protein
MVPRRPGTKIAFIVVSLGLLVGLCALACWLSVDILGEVACRFANIDTQETCG